MSHTDAQYNFQEITPYVKKSYLFSVIFYLQEIVQSRKEGFSSIRLIFYSRAGNMKKVKDEHHANIK